jgi:uncharacterized phage protein (TIGR01671 family)
MSRLIKFRVWNKKTNSWVHGPNEEVNLFGENILLGGFMKDVSVEDLSDCVILQFTGLYDKRLKEIYEGDIVRCFIRDTYVDDDKRDLVHLEVKWEIRPSAYSDHAGFLYIPENREIVGNIFENANLIYG